MEPEYIADNKLVIAVLEEKNKWKRWSFS
jgi:hypothetical protein